MEFVFIVLIVLNVVLIQTLALTLPLPSKEIIVKKKSKVFVGSFVHTRIHLCYSRHCKDLLCFAGCTECDNVGNCFVEWNNCNIFSHIYNDNDKNRSFPRKLFEYQIQYLLVC